MRFTPLIRVRPVERFPDFGLTGPGEADNKDRVSNVKQLLQLYYLRRIEESRRISFYLSTFVHIHQLFKVKIAYNICTFKINPSSGCSFKSRAADLTIISKSRSLFRGTSNAGNKSPEEIKGKLIRQCLGKSILKY